MVWYCNLFQHSIIRSWCSANVDNSFHFSGMKLSLFSSRFPRSGLRPVRNRGDARSWGWDTDTSFRGPWGYRAHPSRCFGTYHRLSILPRRRGKFCWWDFARNLFLWSMHTNNIRIPGIQLDWHNDDLLQPNNRLYFFLRLFCDPEESVLWDYNQWEITV